MRAQEIGSVERARRDLVRIDRGMKRPERRKAKRAPKRPVAVEVEGHLLKLHKATGRGYLELPGSDGWLRRVYAGPYFDASGCRVLPATLAAAREAVHEAQQAGKILPQRERLTVGQLADRFESAMKAGDSWDARGCQTLKALRAEYGGLPARDFGPLALQAWRDRLEREGFKGRRWNRKTLNERVRLVVRCWRWAVGQQLLPPEAWQALQSVEPLKRGRSKAREPRKVRPVSEKAAQAVLPHLSRQLAAVVRLQLLTGARPSELLLLRPGDVDRSGEVWEARPRQHKRAHADEDRVIYLGPEAQEVLRPFLLREPDRPCFSPREAEQERNARRSAESTCSRSKYARSHGERSKRVLRDTYDATAYRKAVKRACKAAEVAVWTPYQLRHTAATKIRAKYGAEAARLLLGHKSTGLVEVYAERDAEAARKIAREVG